MFLFYIIGLGNPDRIKTVTLTYGPTPHIVVVGSSNTDMIIKMDRIPRPGETIIGGEFFTAAGRQRRKPGRRRGAGRAAA